MQQLVENKAPLFGHLLSDVAPRVLARQHLAKHSQPYDDAAQLLVVKLAPFPEQGKLLPRIVYERAETSALRFADLVFKQLTHLFEYNAGAELVIQAINECDEKLAKAVLEDVFSSIFKNFSAMADQAKSFITELETIKNKL